MKQLNGQENESNEIQPISLGLPMVEELEVKLVDMSEYFAEYPQIIVNGWVSLSENCKLSGPYAPNL